MKNSISQTLFCVLKKLVDGVTVLFLCLMFSFFLLPKLGFSFEQVLSDSMTPSITREDLVVLDQYNRLPKVGEVAVFEQEGIRILHRIIGTEKLQDAEEGQRKEIQEGFFYITKGDANMAPDSFLVTGDMIQGTMITVIPKGKYFADFVHSNYLIPVSAALCFLQGIPAKKRIKDTSRSKAQTVRRDEKNR